MATAAPSSSTRGGPSTYNASEDTVAYPFDGGCRSAESKWRDSVSERFL
jgi:hypothetical protein